VDRFEKMRKAALGKTVAKKEKTAKEAPKSLKDMLEEEKKKLAKAA
jgi:hypothetical protein